MSAHDLIYFDNAATSWPKPPCVAEAMLRFMTGIGANPGRGGHRQANRAAGIVYAARKAVADLFHFSDPLRVVFTCNVTEAINLVVSGMLRSGDHVVTGGMEHNAMMRPLRRAEMRGVDVTVVPCTPEGALDASAVADALRPSTALIALNHASNVVGTMLPIADIGRIARANSTFLLVDTAQTAGAVPVDMEADGIDLCAFTGHKSLYGPMGTGGLVIGKRIDPARLTPLTCGGTGSRSEHEYQPDFLPDKYESGTLNVAGLAGLEAGIRWVLNRGIAAIRDGEIDLANKLIEGLRAIPGVTLYGEADARRRVPVVSFNVEGVDPSEAGMRLDEEFSLMCRVGLHCSPASHKIIGTFPRGTIRFGMSVFNTPSEVDDALHAVARLARKRK
ncbi:MAG: aminotransferase class V-fold PLP-dependent enzyme [Chitinispirillaceae bacterium]|nr:aminotransferase class V-fold PLP-dependent enzyme [Chitinispirillaceae bacterium]